MISRAVHACLLAGLAVVASAAQQPTFEVASVKRNLSGRAAGSFQVPPAGTLRYTNVPLRMLIRDAYQVDAYSEQYRLISGPFARIIGSSTSVDPNVPRFDVVAKPPDDSRPEDRRAMMRALLEERFKLRVHRETRQIPVYVMTVAREGRLGPNLQPSKFDCETFLAQRRAGRAGQEPVDANGKSWCLAPFEQSALGVMGTRFAGPVRVLIQRIQPYVDRPIVDATALTGNVEWVLRFARATAPGAGVPPTDVPEIFTALRDQLGLRLEPRQGPVEVLIVDSVELPTAD